MVVVKVLADRRFTRHVLTLKGKQNHYGVKFLRGYGCSVSLKANRVCLNDGADPFTGHAEKEEWFVTQIPYKRIVISGKGYVSTDAIQLLTGHNINVILLDSFGKLVAHMNNVMASPTGTRYRIGQYDTFRNLEKLLYLQKQLLIAKLQSQIEFFKSLNKAELHEVIFKSIASELLRLVCKNCLGKIIRKVVSDLLIRIAKI